MWKIKSNRCSSRFRIFGLKIPDLDCVCIRRIEETGIGTVASEPELGHGEAESTGEQSSKDTGIRGKSEELDEEDKGLVEEEVVVGAIGAIGAAEDGEAAVDEGVTEAFNIPEPEVEIELT